MNARSTMTGFFIQRTASISVPTSLFSTVAPSVLQLHFFPLPLNPYFISRFALHVRALDFSPADFLPGCSRRGHPVSPISERGADEFSSDTRYCVRWHRLQPRSTFFHVIARGEGRSVLLEQSNSQSPFLQQTARIFLLTLDGVSSRSNSRQQFSQLKHAGCLPLISIHSV